MNSNINFHLATTTTTTPRPPQIPEICVKLSHFPVLLKLSIWKGVCPHFPYIQQFSHGHGHGLNSKLVLKPTTPTPIKIKFSHGLNSQSILKPTIQQPAKKIKFNNGLNSEFLLATTTPPSTHLPTKSIRTRVNGKIDLKFSRLKKSQ